MGSHGMIELLRDDVVQAWNEDHLPLVFRRDAASRRLTRLVFLAGAVLYPVWGVFLARNVPGAVDPLAERLAVSVLILAGLAVSGVGRLSAHIATLEDGLLNLMTLHYFTLVWRNGMQAAYVVGLFILLATVGAVIRRRLSAAAFGVTWTAVFCVMASYAPGPRFWRGELVFGVLTLALGPLLGSLRGGADARAARRHLLSARVMLKQIIDAIPDPVFVSSLRATDDRRPRLTNPAFRTLMPAMAERIHALATQWSFVEDPHPEIELESEPAPDIVPQALSLKMAVCQIANEERLLVGVVRDFSERRKLERALELRNCELEAARGRVQQLEGLLPICMHCHRIRDTAGAWESIERYVSDRSRASFTHSICGACMVEFHRA